MKGFLSAPSHAAGPAGGPRTSAPTRVLVVAPRDGPLGPRALGRDVYKRGEVSRVCSTQSTWPGLVELTYAS